jgi:Asp-tRNA(Asn)/Glu-tRNA(Gln) amidotransferase A subunit family amidase
MPTSRRKILKEFTAATLLAATGDAVAATTGPATSQSSNSIPLDDLAAADRVEGRVFSDDDRKLMADAMAGNREKLKALRARHIPPDIEPAIHFDPRVPGGAIPSGSSSCSLSSAPAPDYNGDVKSLAFATGAQLSRLVHARKISSVELTTMYLDRLKSIGPRLNCVITLTEELAMSQARRADAELAAGKSRGPLHGIPWGAKDLLSAKGIPTTWGVSPYADQVFDYDATVVKKLDEAGAILCAKLSMGELAMGDIWFKGLTRSPWKPSEGSGGSSAGPGAAVAAGLVAFAIGTETMGSILNPCMINGVTGLRPTYGRVSRYGAMPLARTMDKIGPMTRGVEDCALVLAAIAGADANDPTAANVPFRWDPGSDLKSLRVGYNPAAFDEVNKGKSAARKKVYAEALEKVRSLVGELNPVTLPPVKPYTGIAGMIIAVESASSFTELVNSGRVRELKQQDAGSWPNTFRSGATIPASDYLRAQQVRTMLQRDFAAAMGNLDLYVNVPYVGPTLAYTNLTGHPTLVCRCGVVDGRPVLLEFLGNLYREDAICRVAFAYEQASDWGKLWPDTDKIPPLSQ